MNRTANDSPTQLINMYRKMWSFCIPMLYFFIQIFCISDQLEWIPPGLYGQTEIDDVISSVWNIHFSNVSEVYPTLQIIEREKIDSSWKKVTEDNNKTFTTVEFEEINVKDCRVQSRLGASKAYSNAQSKVKECVLFAMGYIREKVANLFWISDHHSHQNNHTPPVNASDRYEKYRKEAAIFLEANDEKIQIKLGKCFIQVQKRLKLDMNRLRYDAEWCIEKVQGNL